MNKNVLQKHVKGARHFEGADAMRIVLHTDRILVSRCRDPDGSACMQTRFEGGINRWLEEHQLGCSCGDAGSCVGTSSAQVHVVAFSPSALDALVKPLSEMDFVDRFEKKKGNNVAKFGCLEAHVLPFGMKFKLLVSDVLGGLSVCLQEAESEAPLDSIAGTAVRVSFFFLAGATASRLELPPAVPGRPARGNYHSKVWCGTGEKPCLGFYPLAAIPRIPVGALASEGYFTKGKRPTSMDNDVIAIALLFENGGIVTNKAIFEEKCISNFLHGQHARQEPAAAIPSFSRLAAARGLSSLLGGSIDTGSRRALVSWAVEMPQPPIS